MNTNALFPLHLAGLLVLAACDGQEAPPDEVDEPPVEAPSEAVSSGSGRWTATSSGGSDVTLTVDDPPPLVGPIRVALSIERGHPAAHVVSVDLVSPTMPMHGVVRVPVTKADDGDWAAELEIPMEGLWALYVNLDEDGGDAAEFRFEVAPPSQDTSDSAAEAGHASRREPPPGHARHD